MPAPRRLPPQCCQRVSSLAKKVWGAIFQIAVFIAVLSFVQAQQPTLDRTIDHRDKILTLSKGLLNFSLLHVRIFAVEFDVNFDRDAAGHASINSAKPVSGVSTRGALFEKTVWVPWHSTRVDLKNYGQLPFDEWKSGDLPSPYGLYCLAIEMRNVLSNQSTVELVLTPKQKFAASIFGPMGSGGAMAGDPAPFLAAEAQIKSECLALYDKMR